MSDFMDFLGSLEKTSKDIKKEIEALKEEAKTNPNVKVVEKKTPYGRTIEVTKITNNEVKKEFPKRVESNSKKFIEDTTKAVKNTFSDLYRNLFKDEDNNIQKTIFPKKSNKLKIEKIMLNGPATIVFGMMEQKQQQNVLKAIVIQKKLV